MLIRIIAASLLLILLNILELPKPIAAVLYLSAYLVIGYDILRKAWKGILNGRPFDECFLMAVATLGAIGLAVYEKSGDYNEAVAVMLFYQIGELRRGKEPPEYHRTDGYPPGLRQHRERWTPGTG